MAEALATVFEVEEVVSDLDWWAQGQSWRLKEEINRVILQKIAGNDPAKTEVLRECIRANGYLVVEVGFALLVKHLADHLSGDAERRLNVAVHAERAISKQLGSQEAEQKAQARHKMRRAIFSEGVLSKAEILELSDEELEQRYWEHQVEYHGDPEVDTDGQ